VTALPRDNELLGSRPVPDPTELTTEALHREIGALKELMVAELAGVEKITGERFASVNKQLQLVETQRVEQKKDTKDAVDAALTAQKEAVREQTTASERAIAKSEASTKEQLNQLTATFTTAIGGVTDTLNDLKDRVGRVEAVKVGAQEQRVEQRAQITTAQALAYIVVAIIAALGLYVGFHNGASATKTLCYDVHHVQIACP